MRSTALSSRATVLKLGQIDVVPPQGLLAELNRRTIKTDRRLTRSASPAASSRSSVRAKSVIRSASFDIVHSFGDSLCE